MYERMNDKYEWINEILDCSLIMIYEICLFQKSPYLRKK